MALPEELLLPLLSEHGPWAVLVFWLLWRDQQKERATRELLDRHSIIMAEIGAMLRERLPRAGGRD